MTAIEWTDRTWNPTAGCSRVSSGCMNCYAERRAHRLGYVHEAYVDLTTGGGCRCTHPGQIGYDGRCSECGRSMGVTRGPKWTGKIALFPERLVQPLRWRRPVKVFVDSMSDLFHEDVPDEFIANVFGVMALASWHTYQVLTKRPDRMRRWVAEHTTADGRRIDYIEGREYGERHLTAISAGARWPLPNVWLGVSVENQATADERIPVLLQTPAAVRFVSYEPALGLVDFERIPLPAPGSDFYDLRGVLQPIGEQDTEPDDWKYWTRRGAKLDWIIVGGESGPGARPCDVAWIRSTVEQCRAAKVPVFVKQMGRVIRGDQAGFVVHRYLLRDGRWWVAPLIESDSISTREYVASLKAEAVAFSLGNVKGGSLAEWPEDLRVREMPA